ncbi:MAG: tetratricopeptide repeat protein [Burkholderiales bacterium]|nr:tetratricopeptide repeat protein [Burkholderiales bacterium]
MSDPIESAIQSAKSLFFAREYGKAERIFRQVLSGSPEHPEALHFLGVLTYLAHRYEPAVELIKRALPSRRSDAELHNNLGLALQAAGRYTEAIASFRRALSLVPQSADYHCSLANGLRDSGALKQALRECERAIALRPDFALAHFSRALCQLLLGNCENAWLDHEFRVEAEQGISYALDPRPPHPLLQRPSTWLGSDLTGQRILVVREQGIGDELFFLRFAPALKQRVSWMGYQTSPRMAKLLRGVDCIDEIFEGDDLPEIVDRVMLTGDLPLARPSATQPCPPALDLAASAAMVADARQELGKLGPPPYLGVSWRAGSTPQIGKRPTRRKSIPVEDFAHALQAWPGTIVSLQRQPSTDEITRFASACGKAVGDLSEANEDLERLLALLASMDEYVGVSSVNVHLRASAGRTARVLVSNPPDWRWTEACAQSPWFSGFTLYREERSAGWEAALKRLSADLGSAESPQ